MNSDILWTLENIACFKGQENLLDSLYLYLDKRTAARSLCKHFVNLCAFLYKCTDSFLFLFETTKETRGYLLHL